MSLIHTGVIYKGIDRNTQVREKVLSLKAIGRQLGAERVCLVYEECKDSMRLIRRMSYQKGVSNYKKLFKKNLPRRKDKKMKTD